MTLYITTTVINLIVLLVQRTEGFALNDRQQQAADRCWARATAGNKVSVRHRKRFGGSQRVQAQEGGFLQCKSSSYHVYLAFRGRGGQLDVRAACLRRLICGQETPSVD